jgi:hypothetical protein
MWGLINSLAPTNSRYSNKTFRHTHNLPKNNKLPICKKIAGINTVEKILDAIKQWGGREFVNTDKRD